MRGSIAVACIALVAACGGAGTHPPARPVSELPETTVDKAAEMFIELGNAVMAAKSDCDVMAANVAAWLDENTARRARINAALLGIHEDGMKKRYRARLNAHLDVVFGMKAGLDGCHAHGRFRTVWKRLDE